MPEVSQQREVITKKASSYVPGVLEEFGEQKWGRRKRDYEIYYAPPTESEFGVSTNPNWLVVSSKGALFKRKTGRGGKDVLKYPCYKVTLNLSFLDLGLSMEPRFNVEYGGYSDYEFEADGVCSEYISTEEATESALRQALSEVITENLEPLAVLSWELESPGYKKVK